MATAKQSYLICNGCGEACRLDMSILYGETDDCVRDQAEDECDWAVRLGGGADRDYCLECQKQTEEE